jgi:hypothetical protein
LGGLHFVDLTVFSSHGSSIGEKRRVYRRVPDLLIDALLPDRSVMQRRLTLFPHLRDQKARF